MATQLEELVDDVGNLRIEICLLVTRKYIQRYFTEEVHSNKNISQVSLTLLYAMICCNYVRLVWISRDMFFCPEQSTAGSLVQSREPDPLPTASCLWQAVVSKKLIMQWNCSSYYNILIIPDAIPTMYSLCNQLNKTISL